MSRVATSNACERLAPFCTIVRRRTRQPENATHAKQRMRQETDTCRKDINLHCKLRPDIEVAQAFLPVWFKPRTHRQECLCHDGQHAGPTVACSAKQLRVRRRLLSRRLDSRRSLQLTIANFLLAHAELLNFTGDRHRKRFDKANVVWNLEMRDSSAAILSNFVFRSSLA